MMMDYQKAKIQSSALKKSIQKKDRQINDFQYLLIEKENLIEILLKKVRSKQLEFANHVSHTV